MAKSKQPEPMTVELPENIVAKGQPAPPAPERAPLARVCGTCIFWASFRAGPEGYRSVDREGAQGICRRNPPVAPLVFNMIEDAGPFRVARAVWPLTFIGENCGGWEGGADGER